MEINEPLIVSQANVVLTKGWVFSGSGTLSSVALAIFRKHKAVPISSICDIGKPMAIVIYHLYQFYVVG